MYLTAQRVVSPASGKTGINAYAYSHGLDWQVPPESVLDTPPTELTAEHVEVPPPGNRVRSYLDIAVPVTASPDEVSEAMTAFLSARQGQAFPWEGVEGRCAFRLGMEQALATMWRVELAALLKSLEAALDGASSPAR